MTGRGLSGSLAPVIGFFNLASVRAELADMSPTKFEQWQNIVVQTWFMSIASVVIGASLVTGMCLLANRIYTMRRSKRPTEPTPTTDAPSAEISPFTTRQQTDRHPAGRRSRQNE